MLGAIIQGNMMFVCMCCMQLYTTLLVFAHSGEDPSTAKLRYTIVYNSSRALRFQQIYVGSLSKPDGRTGICLY